jgi:eukaryotic-like serine/threonine-protein kinase
VVDVNRTRSTSAGLDDAFVDLRESSVQGRALEKRAIAAQLFGDDDPAPRIGRFTILRRIGRGGMGEVFAARDAELDRVVAIKVMRRRGSQAIAERFLREGRALAKLSHTNIVQVHEVGEHDGKMFIAMEHVAGQTLREWMHEDGGAKPYAEIITVFLAAASGLAAAHAAGLVHRDFKPDNVMIGADGRVRVLDFGLARSVDTHAFEFDSSTTESNTGSDTGSGTDPGKPERSDPRMTETGITLGTPAYMAPEQHRAEPATAASDQFGFCVTLFEALYGIRPFFGSTRRELLESIETGRIWAKRDRRVPKRVHRAVIRGLAPEPGARWPSMAELEAALRASLRPRLRWSRVAGAGVLAVVAVFAGLGLRQQPEPPPVCEGARERLVGVWDEAERERVRDAMLATELAFAPTTWAQVEAGLDAYAEAWVAGHRDACEATRVHEIQSAEAMDLRMTCLDQRRGQLEAVVEALARTDAASIDRALDLVLDLPSVERCTKLDLLREDLPPPEDPALAEEVARIRGRLAAIRALFAAGRIDEIEAESEALTWQARTTTYGPVWAEALAFHGEVLAAKADYPEAEAQLDRAFILAAKHGHVEVQAEAARLLALVVGKGQANLVSGRAWGKTALALAIRPGADEEAEAQALTSIAVLEQHGGEMGAGYDQSRRALGIRERAHGPDDLRVAESLGNHARVTYNLQLRPELLAFVRARPATTLAMDDLHQRRNVEAIALLERAIAIIEAKLGPDHPRLIVELTSLATILEESGETDQALEHQTRALDIAERTRVDHPDIARAALGLGALRYGRGEIEPALALFERARALLERALPPSNPAIADPLVRSCMASLELDRLDDARASCRRALTLREDAFGPEHASIATPAVLLGLVMQRQGDLDDARVLLERGHGLLAHHNGGGHLAVLIPIVALAELELAQGNWELALAHADTAIRVSEQKLEQVTPGWPRFLRAKALAGDPKLREAAREAATEARRELLLDGRFAREVAMVDAWLE